MAAPIIKGDRDCNDERRGPRGPCIPGPPGRPGKDGKDAIGDIGSSDTIYVPIFARIPDVEAGAAGTNANNWSVPDSKTQVQTWLGVTITGEDPPITAFYFTYSDSMIPTDSITGQPLTPYPGERHPKGYRIGDLLGEP